MQSFILDRHTDPSNPVMKVTQDDKIPIYDSLADAQADIANIEEGQIGMTKDTGAEFPDLQEYIRNQNILDDWEPISISTDSNNPTVIPYDGFLSLVVSGNNRTGSALFINGQHIGNAYLVLDNVVGTFSVTHSIPVAKGDLAYITGELHLAIPWVRYYKLRDYTGR